MSKSIRPRHPSEQIMLEEARAYRELRDSLPRMGSPVSTHDLHRLLDYIGEQGLGFSAKRAESMLKAAFSNARTTGAALSSIPEIPGAKIIMLGGNEISLAYENPRVQQPTQPYTP